MTDINLVMINGNLTRDAEAKATAGGMTILTLSIANNRTKKVGDKYEDVTNFFEVVIFGKRADGLKPYLLKGQKISVTGELRQDRWEQDGQKRSKDTILANEIQLLGKGDGKAETKKSDSRYASTDDFASEFESPDVPF